MKAMQNVYKKPFEAVVLLLVIYYCLVVLFFEPVIFSVKTSYICSGIGVWLLFLIIGVAFKKEFDAAKLRLLTIYSLRLFAKVKVLILLGTPILLVTSFSEYILSTLFISGGSVAIGFPLSIYSFSASKFLLFNLILDLLLSVGLLYFVGYVLKSDKKKI